MKERVNNKKMDEEFEDSKEHFVFPVFLLMSSRLSLAISGPLFWWVAARKYSIEDIGLASVLISVASLLTFFSSLGATSTFVRFLPSYGEKANVIDTLLTFSLLLLIFSYSLLLFILRFFFPQIIFLKSIFYLCFFLIFIVVIQVFQILDGVYIAFRSTNLVLLKNVVQNFLRIGILFFVISWGGVGIFFSNCLAAGVAILLSFFLFFKRFPLFRVRLKLDTKILKKILPFSLVNFLNSISWVLPGAFFPLLILYLFSEKEAGLFYIPWMIFSVCCNLLVSVNTIFLREASYQKSGKSLLIKVSILSFLLGMGGLVFFSFFDQKILSLFGKEFSYYSSGILKILFYSIFFFIINQIYITILNINKKVKEVGMISMFIILSIIVFTFLFLPRMGIEGVALAWLISNFLASIYVFFNFKKFLQAGLLLEER